MRWVLGVVLWGGWVALIIAAAAVVGGLVIGASVRALTRDQSQTDAFVHALRRGIAAALGVILFGAACWVITDHVVHAAAPPVCATTSAPLTPGAPVGAPIAIKANSTYVALGDSYAAGEGLAPFEVQRDASCNNCDRSPRAYPRLLRFSDPVTVVFVACSGATMADIASGVTSLARAHAGPLELDNIEQNGPNANQPTTTSLGAPSAAVPAPGPVRFVTINISGNDALFSTVVVYCFERSHCLTSTAHGGFQDGKSLQDWGKQRIKDIGTALPKLFDLLHTRMPDARIVVLGYPLLFTSRSPSAFADQGRCALYGRWASDERTGLIQLEEQLDATIRTTAASNHAEFIDTATLFRGHEPCTRHEWVNFAVLSLAALKNDPAKLVAGGSFHPNQFGQEAFAAAVSCYMAAHPQAPPAGAAPSVASFQPCFDHTMQGLIGSRAQP